MSIPIVDIKEVAGLTLTNEESHNEEAIRLEIYPTKKEREKGFRTERIWIKGNPNISNECKKSNDLRRIRNETNNHQDNQSI